MDIRIAVVEDHEIVGTALCRALSAIDGFTVVGLAPSADRAVDLVERTRPDVVLLDLRLGREHSVDRVGELRAASARTRVLVVTAWATEHAMDQALSNGAAGLMSKVQPLSELVEAVRQVHAGQTIVCPELVPALVRRATERVSQCVDARDVEVLELLAAAWTTSEIAGTLCLSEHTVRNRIHTAMAKLDAHSRVEAVSEAMRRGLVLPAEPELTPSLS